MPYRDPVKQRQAQREANERRKLDPIRTKHRNDVRNATRRRRHALGIPEGAYAKLIGLGRRRPTEDERRLVRALLGVHDPLPIRATRSKPETAARLVSPLKRELHPIEPKVLVPIVRALGAVSAPTREPAPSVATLVKPSVARVTAPKLNKRKQRVPKPEQRIVLLPRNALAPRIIEPTPVPPAVRSELLRSILHTADCDCSPCAMERYRARGSFGQ